MIKYILDKNQYCLGLKQLKLEKVEYKFEYGPSIELITSHQHALSLIYHSQPPRKPLITRNEASKVVRGQLMAYCGG